MAGKNIEIEIAGKAPDGAESTKSVKMDWIAFALLLVAVLIGIGAIVPGDVFDFIKNLPSGLLP